MRIAIDCDGVLVEWERTARYLLRTYRGLDLPTVSTEWDSIQGWVSEDDWQWLWSEGIKLGLFKHGHVVTGAIAGMKALSELGYDLLVVTARPKEAVNDTLGWLAYHMQDIPLAGVTILSRGEPKSVVDAAVLVDDKLENIYEWPRRGLLFDQPWNWGIESKRWDETRMRRVRGWEGVVDALRN